MVSRMSKEDAKEGGVGRLLKRWIRRQGNQDQHAPEPASSPELQPPGQRSGKGAESVTPYLEEGRTSRPAPLE